MMRLGGDHIGPRSALLLAVTAAAGIALGVHGWSVRQHGVPSSLASPQSSAPATTPAPGSSPTPAPTPTSSSSPVQGPTRPAASPSPSPAVTAGPKLSSQSFASYSFQVWPGTPSATAQAAATGLVIKVSKQGSGISVVAGVAGQPLPAAKFYPGGVRVYVVEASMGDDSGNSDFNLGDDGLIVTDSQGRILQ